MPTITPRKNKSGEIISYTIRVYHGYDSKGKRLKPYTMTYRPAPGMTAKQIDKELNRQAVMFEEQCNNGFVLDNKQTFSEYAQYVIELKERTGAKYKTIQSYKYLLERTNKAIGHIKLCDLRPQHLNKFYDMLSKEGVRDSERKCVEKCDLKNVIKQQYSNREKFAAVARVSIGTVDSACKGNKIKYQCAELIANTLQMSVDKLFNVEKDLNPLSNKTILEYHRFISAVLTQAEKELLVEYNMARKATPPKYKPKAANYFQPEEIELIREKLELEPIKWKVIIHLLLITGARRGEIAGLKWDSVDFKNMQIHICRNLEYSVERGIYEDTLKTEESDRYIKLPSETMELLKEYRKWYLNCQRLFNDKWEKNRKEDIKGYYLFIQEETGKPIHPDSINSHLTAFSEKYNLPHINPHAFRHTMASLLYFNGVDGISISKRLGHSKVSTTTDIYSHIIKQADEQAAECIADVVLRKHKNA